MAWSASQFLTVSSELLLLTHYVQTSHVYINKIFQCKNVNISYPSFLTYILGAQKNRHIETVLLSTHNICFGWEIIRKLNFDTQS